MNKTESLYQNLKKLAIGLKPEDRFPSTRDIMTRYRVSQVTVIQATERLIRDGLIVKSQGKSTRVTEQVRLYQADARPVFCLALPHWNSAWLNSLETAFLAEADELGYELRIHIYDWKLDPAAFPQERVDAFFIAPFQITAEILLQLKRLPVPVLFLGDCEFSDFSSVGADNAHIGMLAATHLIELGHRKTAFVYVRNEKDEHCSIAEKRLRSFRDTCELWGAECLPVEVMVAEGELDYRKVYEAFQNMLAVGIDFTAVCTCCAPQALRAVLESGLRVPRDISMLTIGEDPMYEFTYPGLSSISGNQEAIVRQAVEQAFAEINHGAAKRWMIVRHSIIPRESTAKRDG